MCVGGSVCGCGEDGAVEVTTGGLTHRITVSRDRIAQQPTVRHVRSPDGVVKKGTRIQLTWPEIAGLLAPDADDRFDTSASDLLREYAAVNPHLQVTYHVLTVRGSCLGRRPSGTSGGRMTRPPPIGTVSSACRPSWWSILPKSD
jgi:hypothetical protein